ncbi:MAG: sulfatase [Planctomycetes bacterium]|nr:sulfatase [Planctomycetota bacterium]
MRVLYIDIDTLRPDHLGCYGYLRDTSPNIDRIASEGVRFDNCYASDTPCLPSRAAMFTGRFGIHNGAVNHGGLAADIRLEGAQRGFKCHRQHLPDLMRKLGLWTVSVSPFGERHTAMWFYKGFNEMLNTGKSGNERADEIVPHAIDWIERKGHQDNWFLHVNVWDPHTLYRTPEEYGNPFEGQPCEDWLTQEMIDEQRKSYGVRCALDPTDRQSAPTPRMVAEIKTPQDYRHWIDGYDTGIRYADDHIGMILAALEKKGVLKDTVIMVTSDHGENQGELNIYGDHHTADAITPRIPMILRMPGALKPGAQEGLFYQFDVGASLVSLLGGEIPDYWDAEVYAEDLKRGVRTGRPYLVLGHCVWSVQRSVRFDDHIFIRTYHPGLKDLPGHMVFDLKNDPHETNNLADGRPDLVGKALTMLDEWHTEQMRTSDAAADPLWTVMREGGPYHTRGRLESYCRLLESFGPLQAEHAARLRAEFSRFEKTYDRDN